MKDKGVRPPYTSYRSFMTLIEELRSHDVLPGVIDRSFLSRRSGSEQSALIATLKWFQLIDDSGVPTKLLAEFIAADSDTAQGMLKEMVEGSYGFVTDGAFPLERATTNMLAEKFREFDISGSTLSKSVSFFLAAAKEAGITVSPHAKAPPAPRAANRRKTKPVVLPPAPEPPSRADSPTAPQPPRPGMVAIPIPIFGGQDGVIYLPGQMTERQWESVIKMTEFILRNYRETMADSPQADEEDDP